MPRQQLNFVQIAANATLPPFRTTDNPGPSPKNDPFRPGVHLSPNIQQHIVERAILKALPHQNPVFTPNTTAPISHAPLINQPPVPNSLRNK